MRANGNADNQVIRGFLGPIGPAAIRQAFLMMDRWLAAIEADKASDTIAKKVARSKPSDAVDACFASSGGADADVVPSKGVGISSAACPVTCGMTSPPVVAGGPLAQDIFKCQLKPFTSSDPDYGGAIFTSAQQARLASLFSSGVCDWSKPGVGQMAAEPTLTFQAGPGGAAMPPAPAWESPVSIAVWVS